MDSTLGVREGRAKASQESPADDRDRALWAALGEAATSEAFCQAWLTLQCRMITGVTGGMVILGPPDSGPFRPVAIWPDIRRNLTHLAISAERALKERRGLVRKPDPEVPDSTSAPSHYEIAYPIETRGRLHGVAVLELAPRPQPQLQAALRQLRWGAPGLQVLLWREEVLKEATARGRLQTVLELLATLVSHESSAAAAMAFVTALATRLQCDRVSVGFLRGGRAQIKAMSHSAQFGKQTNLVRAIGSAMEEAADQQATVLYPAPRDTPARVIRAHAELARQHGSGANCSIPLSHGERVHGTLTLERPADRPFEPLTVELCEALAALAGPILEFQRRDDRWLVTKAAETFRTWLAHLIGPRHMALKLTAAAAAAVVVFFAVAMSDYRVSATTTLEPEIRRAAVSPFNGYIAEARERAGDVVRQDQVLAALDDREMRLERLKWLSQHEQLVRQYRQAMAKHEAAQVRILTAQIEQVNAQLTLLEDQLSRTRVMAPFNGIVVTGDLSQMLGSPVERGQVLFEIAPLEAYRLILQVDERDIADVTVGQRGRLLLSAFPEEPLPFRVGKVTPVSTAREGRNYFRVEAQLENTPKRLRPGMEGVGKIEVDRRLLVWIWTRQAIDWLRLKLWTWMP